LLLTL